MARAAKNGHWKLSPVSTVCASSVLLVFGSSADGFGVVLVSGVCPAPGSSPSSSGPSSESFSFFKYRMECRIAGDITVIANVPDTLPDGEVRDHCVVIERTFPNPSYIQVERILGDVCAAEHIVRNFRHTLPNGKRIDPRLVKCGFRYPAGSMGSIGVIVQFLNIRLFKCVPVQGFHGIRQCQFPKLGFEEGLAGDSLHFKLHVFRKLCLAEHTLQNDAHIRVNVKFSDICHPKWRPEIILRCGRFFCPIIQLPYVCPTKAVTLDIRHRIRDDQGKGICPRGKTCRNLPYGITVDMCRYVHVPPFVLCYRIECCCPVIILLSSISCFLLLFYSIFCSVSFRSMSFALARHMAAFCLFSPVSPLICQFSIKKD